MLRSRCYAVAAWRKGCSGTVRANCLCMEATMLSQPDISSSVHRRLLLYWAEIWDMYYSSGCAVSGHIARVSWCRLPFPPLLKQLIQGLVEGTLLSTHDNLLPYQPALQQPSCSKPGTTEPRGISRCYFTWPTHLLHLHSH